MLTSAQINAAKKLLAGGATVEQVAPAIGTTVSELQNNMSFVNPQLPVTATAAGVGGKLGSLGTMFAGLRSKFGTGKTLGPNLFNGDWNSAKKLLSDVQNTNVLGLGKVKTLGNIGMGAYQGIKGLSNLNKLSEANSDLDDMMAKVRTSQMSNPLYASYLDSGQKALLRKVQNGTYGSGAGVSAGLDSGVKALPKAALSALAGALIGGPWGAAIQGIGTLANAGLEGATKAKESKASQLQGLYETLSNAEQDYNSMRRPSNLLTSGLQRRYSSQLI